MLGLGLGLGLELGFGLGLGLAYPYPYPYPYPYQGMIARYKNGLPPQPACALQAPPRVSDSRLSVFVRCRPLLPEEAKSGGFDVITTEGAEEGAGLALTNPNPNPQP